MPSTPPLFPVFPAWAWVGPAKLDQAVPVGSFQALTAASLPDDLLAIVFSHLHPAERHGTAALVCRRWRQVSHNPHVQRSLRITLSAASPAAFLNRLCSLAEWLVAHAVPHVRQLNLSLSFDADGADESVQHEVTAVLTSMLAACRQLEVLQLDLRDFTIPLSSWLAPLSSSLRVLTVWTSTSQLAVGSLRSLSALRELDLCADQIDLDEGVVIPGVASLPQGLTRLWLSCCSGEQMPEQMGSLPLLADLTLYAVNHESNGFVPLTRLRGSLRRLDLQYCGRLPACLHELSWLGELAITDDELEMEEECIATLTAALHQLTGLTSLSMRLGGPHSLLAAMAGLPQLRRFQWWDVESAWCRNPGRLPDGTWLGSIERLVAPAGLLANSLQQLSAAAQLAHLCVTGVAEAPAAVAAAAVAVVSWAAHNPGLQHLGLQAHGLPHAVANAVKDGQLQRPGLCINSGLEAAEFIFSD